MCAICKLILNKFAIQTICEVACFCEYSILEHAVKIYFT